MRLRLLLPVVATTLFFTGVAAAQSAPGTLPPNSAGSASSTDGEDPDEEPQTYAQRKNWSVGSSFETNRTILQEDVGGGQKAFNTLNFFASYNITGHDVIRVSGGFMQRFIADQTETGIRADDIGLSYSHGFKLPWQLTLQPTVGNTFPVSLNSQRMSIIATPRGSLGLSRNFFNQALNVSIHGGAAYYIVKYKEASSPDDDQGLTGPNPRFTTNIGFNVNVSMPFHPALSVGGGASTSWSWSYDPDHANDPTLAAQFKNAPVEPSADPYFNHPAGQQGYGGDVYISYSLPSLKDINSNFQVTMSQNDGVLRDGATHLYWLSRRGGQVSASLTISY
jgi:hypothetical protein